MYKQRICQFVFSSQLGSYSIHKVALQSITWVVRGNSQFGGCCVPSPKQGWKNHLFLISSCPYSADLKVMPLFRSIENKEEFYSKVFLLR